MPAPSATHVEVRSDNAEDQVSHWICCDDPTDSVTLCGAPTTLPLGGPDDPDPDCVVCDDLAGTGYCPLGHPC